MNRASRYSRLLNDSDTIIEPTSHCSDTVQVLCIHRFRSSSLYFTDEVGERDDCCAHFGSDIHNNDSPTKLPAIRGSDAALRLSNSPRRHL